MANQIPSNKQLKQLFHQLNMELFQAKSPLGKQQAQMKFRQVKEALASVMTGPNALRNRDGYIIIGEQAYGKYEAYSKALEDMAYFYEHGTHMPPLKYPTTPPDKIPQNRWREVYPDVTSEFDKELAQIRAKIQSIPMQQRFALFAANFGNNGQWDLQVGHGLPGQVPKQGTDKPFIVDSEGNVVTQDQYAIYKGRL